MQLRRKLQTQQVDVDGLNGGSQLDTGNTGHVVLLRRERSGCGAAAERLRSARLAQEVTIDSPLLQPELVVITAQVSL